MGKLVNQRELSEIVGVSQQTLCEWQKEEGFPLLVKGDPGEENRYDSAEVMAWRIARERRGARPETERDRLTRLQANMLQLEISEKEKALVPADQVEPVWKSRVLTAAAYMLGRHSRLAGMLEATVGMEAKRQLLKVEDAEFLTRLGVHGERYQAELDALFSTLPMPIVEAFFRRLDEQDEERLAERRAELLEAREEDTFSLVDEMARAARTEPRS